MRIMLSVFPIAVAVATSLIFVAADTGSPLYLRHHDPDSLTDATPQPNVPIIKSHHRNLGGGSSSYQFERIEFTTECVECEQASTTNTNDNRADEGQQANNNYERSDDKEEEGGGGGGDNVNENEEEEEDENSKWFEPTLEPTADASFDQEDATYVTDIAQDENKVEEAVEEKIECEWCHDDDDRPPQHPSHHDQGIDNSGYQGTTPDDTYDYPRADPPSYKDRHHEGGGHSRLVDDMVAPFFLLAAILLILALVYTLLFLCVVRLGTIRIDEDRYPRGRVYFCGSLCFVPLCWFYRLYAADPAGGVGIASSTDARVMGLRREERKEAVAELLKQYSVKVGEEEEKTEEKDENQEVVNIASNIDLTSSMETDGDEGGSDDAPDVNGNHDSSFADAEENQCSICLDGYGGGDTYVTSPTTCPHRFHHDCLLDWLTRRCNTACPCCRRDLISNDDVWNVHQAKGRERRRRRRKERGWLGFRHSSGGGARDRLNRLRGRSEGGPSGGGSGDGGGESASEGENNNTPTEVVQNQDTATNSPAATAGTEEAQNHDEPAFQTEEQESSPEDDVQRSEGDIEMGRM